MCIHYPVKFACGHDGGTTRQMCQNALKKEIPGKDYICPDLVIEKMRIITDTCYSPECRPPSASGDKKDARETSQDELSTRRSQVVLDWVNEVEAAKEPHGAAKDKGVEERKHGPWHLSTDETPTL
jgi:hypothetical protein